MTREHAEGRPCADTPARYGTLKGVPITKAERLLDLVIALLNSRSYRTAGWIRDHVAGYADTAGDEAFSRMFERDKQELRDLGIPIETPPAGDGYRIRPGDFALPPMTFTAAESAALAVASRLWETTVLADAGPAGLRKLRDAAGDHATGSETPRPDHETAGDAASQALDQASLPGVQARVRTAEPAFSDLYAAIRVRRAVRFDYRPASASESQSRAVQPWGLVNYRGAWYVTGYDTVREAQRTFRLSRITGRVTATGRSGAVSVPEGIDLKQAVVSGAELSSLQAALLRIRTGQAYGLRRRGTVLESAASDDGYDDVQVSMTSIPDMARRVAAHGPEVVVVDPPELQEAVLALLRGSAVNGE